MKAPTPMASSVPTKKLDTVNLKGKKYVLVQTRIKAFDDLRDTKFVGYGIESDITDVVENGKEAVRCHCRITFPDGRIAADGWAQEVIGSSNVNKTSVVENCATSAIGRALGVLGIGIDDEISLASHSEVADAIIQQKELEIQELKKNNCKRRESFPKERIANAIQKLKDTADCSTAENIINYLFKIGEEYDISEDDRSLITATFKDQINDMQTSKTTLEFAKFQFEQVNSKSHLVSTLKKYNPLYRKLLSRERFFFIKEINEVCDRLTIDYSEVETFLP